MHLKQVEREENISSFTKGYLSKQQLYFYSQLNYGRFITTFQKIEFKPQEN